MAAVTPPTLAQIKKMRDSLKNCNDYRVIVDMGETVFDSTMSLLIWDDANMLLHVIGTCSELYNQARAPFKICHVSYDQIEAIYANIKQ